MNRCSCCGHKVKSCSCERRGRRTMKKMRKSKILESHLVDGTLAFRLAKKDGRIWHVKADLKSKEIFSEITEGQYQESVRKGKIQKELSGPIIMTEYFASLDSPLIVLALGPKNFEYFFQFDGKLTPITADQAYNFLLDNSIAEF